ncbi:MAG: exostosin family protein [Pseudomonadota bacterium]
MAKKLIYIPEKSEFSLATHWPHLRLELLQSIEAHDGVELAPDAQSADLVAFFEDWSTQQPSYVHTVTRNPFFREHWKKLYTINDDDIVPGLLPGLYTSLERHTFDPTIHRACAYPRTYNDEVEKSQDPIEPEVLATFRGKPNSSPLRDRLADELADAENVRITLIFEKFHDHSETQKSDYVNDILSAHAVLCPRGWSPSTYRMYETMALGRCPIVIADDWIEIKGVDWSECSIRVAENQLGEIDAILASRAEDLRRLGENAQRVFKKHFSSDTRAHFFIDQLLELHENRSHRDYRKDWNRIQYWRKRGEGLRSHVKRRAKALLGA